MKDEAAHRQQRGYVICTHRARARGGCSLVTGGRCFYVHQSLVLVMQQSLLQCVLSSHWYTYPNRHHKAITKLLRYFAVAPRIGEQLGGVVDPTAADLLVNGSTARSLSPLARDSHTNPDEVFVLYICSLHDG